MHRLLLILCALALGACSTQEKSRRDFSTRHKAGSRAKIETPANRKSGDRMVVRTTAYTHTEPGGSVNAIGGRLRFHHSVRSAASDWSWLPLGTRFRMVGSNQEYVIEDYGSALVDRKTIDLYMPERGMMNRWGVRHVEIEILEWGSKTMSLRLLEPRQKYGHIRRMVASLRAQGVKTGS